MSNNAARKGIQLSMKPNQVNFIRIKTDKDAIKQEEKAWIYKKNLTYKESKIYETYIGVTKKKIRERKKWT